MLKFPLWKKFFVLAILLVSVLFALPNALSPEGREQLPDFMPTKTINLGLDLQGGSHMLLEIDLEATLTRAYENLEGEVRSIMASNRLSYSNLRAKSDKGVSFLLRHAKEKEQVVSTLRDELRHVMITEEGATVYVTYTEDELKRISNHAVKQSLEVLRSRVDEFGVSEPVIQRQGTNRIIIELPGVKDAARAKDIIGRTAQLTFHMVNESMSPAEALRGRPPVGSAIYYEEQADASTGMTSRIPYLLRKRPPLTGENLAGANATVDQFGQPAVTVKFDSKGTRKFGRLTTENVGRRMAIVLDGQVYSAPVLREPILGGSAEITGNFTNKEAEDLATVLRAGALPAPVEIIEERTIGPSLGQDSIEAGKRAVVVGFVAVLLLMLLFYRGFGMAANVALLFNVSLIMAIMTAIGATLTLPGIAGIVLTIGMAVDANVLIFERIREETRKGKSPMLAIDSGFKSAFGTILDANITTIIAAIVMYGMGSGPIKGFALTLSIGILASMFTAIMVTRLMVVSWLKTTRPKKLAV